MEDEQGTDDDRLLEMEKRIVDKLLVQLAEAVAKAGDGISQTQDREVGGEGFVLNG